MAVDIFNPTSFRLKHPPRTVDDYLELITSEHKNKPKFAASLAAVLEPLVSTQGLIMGMPRAFDVDVAIGVQLDATGKWIGRSRFIPQPLPNPWFYFDNPNLQHGWDRGFWKGPYDVGTMLDRLDDETYRRLLYAKIGSNNWDGTIAGAQAALEKFFTLADNPDTYILVDDESRAIPPPTGPRPITSANQCVTVAIAGKIPPIVDLEIFAQDLIPLSIAGVDQEVKVVSVDETPMFGFDLDNQYIAGFGTGSWGVDPSWMVDFMLND